MPRLSVVAFVPCIVCGIQRHGHVNDGRPQLHFTPDQGWMNDPNGLVYYDGEYHLFFQRTKENKTAGLKSWGHAVSTNLLHWRQLPDALKADEYGNNVYSGSVVVDEDNTSGWRLPGKHPPMVAFYTNASWARETFEQHMAISHDKGRTWVSSGDAVIPAFAEEIRNHARDPKVQWHRQSQKWIMVLYVSEGRVLLYGSANLRSWHKLQLIHFKGAHECPDFIELQDPAGISRWVLMMGDGSYEVGDFDGERYTSFTDRRYVEYGSGYAFATFNGIQDKIQISWIKDKTHPIFESVPFVGMMSFPMKLDLTANFFVRRSPIAQLSQLRAEPALISSSAYSETVFTAGTPAIRSDVSTSCILEAVVRTTLPPSSGVMIEFKHPHRQGLQVRLFGSSADAGPTAKLNLAAAASSGNKTSMPLRAGHDDVVHVHFLIDWGVLEMFDVSGHASMALFSSDLATYNNGHCSSKVIEFKALSGAPSIHEATVHALTRAA